MLPEGDRTPPAWRLPEDSLRERGKRPLRRLLYPLYHLLCTPSLGRRFDPAGKFAADDWYWGPRGLEPDSLRLKLSRYCEIAGRAVLVAGCGTGRDVPSWLRFRPARLVGVDYFDYSRAWEAQRHAYRGPTDLTFLQRDIADLADVADDSIDVIGSDAVFEHVIDLATVLSEFHRVLKPGGILYAGFGPMWFCWGGDHISGYQGNGDGYNHLLLAPADYERYLDAAGEFQHSEHDGRTWIANGLFSYLRPREYLELLAGAGFERCYLGIEIDPRGVGCLRRAPELLARLLAHASELELVAKGMVVIYRKPAAAAP